MFCVTCLIDSPHAIIRVCLDVIPARPAALWITCGHTVRVHFVFIRLCAVTNQAEGKKTWVPHAGGCSAV